jgi:hypothetical protein
MNIFIEGQVFLCGNAERGEALSIKIDFGREVFGIPARKTCRLWKFPKIFLAGGAGAPYTCRCSLPGQKAPLGFPPERRFHVL